MKTLENKLVFVVDDDALYTKAVSDYLLKEFPELQIQTFTTGEACLHSLSLMPVAIILDYYLNSEFEFAWNGLQLLKKMHAAYPAINIIIISAQKEVEIALNCLKEGAYEYLTKNENTLPAIKRILENIADDPIEK
jgi:DNA-binding NtrC family response regulator